MTNRLFALLLLAFLLLPAPVMAKEHGTLFLLTKEVIIWPFRAARALIKLPAYVLDGNFKEWVRTEP